MPPYIAGLPATTEQLNTLRAQMNELGITPSQAGFNERAAGAGVAPNIINERGAFVLGDSRHVLWRDPSKKIKGGEMYINQANALMGGRMQILGGNAASAQRTDEYLATARVAEAVASGARYIFIGIGPLNDIAQAGTIGDFDHFSGPGYSGFSGVKAVLDYLVSIGRVPIISTDPGATNLTTTAQFTALWRWNQKVRQYAAQMTGKVIFIDIAATEQDHANVTAAAIAFPANFKYDATHNSTRGGAILGAKLAEILTPLIPAFPQPFSNDNDVVANGGQGLSNAAFKTQTGGTVSLGSVSNGGAAPSGWTISDDSTIQSVSVDVSTDVLTLNNHGYPDGTPLTFTGGTLPGGVNNSTIYYIRDTTTNTFKVAATVGGAAIDLTGSPSGVQARLRNVSAAISYEADDNGFAVVAALTWYKPGNFLMLQNLAAVENPGETWQSSGRVRLSSGHANCAGGFIQIESSRATVTYPVADLYMDSTASSKALAAGAYDWSQTPPDITINSGARGWFSYAFRAYGVASGATATVKFSRPRLAKKLTL